MRNISSWLVQFWCLYTP